jgi:hypothetical protein
MSTSELGQVLRVYDHNQKVHGVFIRDEQKVYCVYRCTASSRT